MATANAIFSSTGCQRPYIVLLTSLSVTASVLPDSIGSLGGVLIFVEYAMLAGYASTATIEK